MNTYQIKLKNQKPLEILADQLVRRDNGFTALQRVGSRGAYGFAADVVTFPSSEVESVTYLPTHSVTDLKSGEKQVL